jgi:hypothetical protein
MTISKKLITGIGLLSLVSISSCFLGGGGQDAIPDKVSYNFDVRPIFSDKCFACHGPDALKRKANLRLDLKETAFLPLTETKGAFALVPGKPDESEVYKRIVSTNPDYQMPSPESHLGLLTEREIALVKKWIEQGAQYEKHWAFISPKKTTPPEVSDKDWVRNPIDQFVLAKLDEIGLTPNKDADKERLLKRVSLDLTGLPPSTKLMDQFLKDQSDNAFEKVVDQLLSQPAYGEKMGLMWLDIARYSDSYGYQDDNIRTQWPWRDWVIHAFNKNLPYDQFLTWQIAGDMLPNPTKEQLLATGFFRNHKYTEEGGVIPEEYRVEYLIDKMKTYGKGILALTIECSQCHDHKYDPFSQKDYYQMMAFFNNTKELGFEGDVSVSKPAKNPLMTITAEDRAGILSFINAKDTNTLTVSVMGELQDTTRKTFTLKRGRYDMPDQEVYPQALPAVMKYDEKKYPKNRLGLALWTIDKQNPLTARVFVNQLWQELFGRGIVKTTGDFGMQGERPTHPELLDWLAADFMENGWDVKRLVRTMVFSSTYRQSAQTDKAKQARDPENAYYSHAPRSRVKAEIVRDIVLSSSGLLVPTIGGPSVKPYQPKGLWEAATSGRGVLATYKQDHGDALYRRGMYTFIKLTVPPPAMILFDASNRDQCEVKRSKTNTPLQALMMMNDPLVLEASRVLAQKLMQEGGDSNQQIESAFKRIICRKATAKELEVMKQFYQEQLQGFQAKKLDAELTLKAGEFPMNEKLDKKSLASLMKTINVIYNLEEAITKS